MNEMTQVLGTVAMEPKGEYNSETYYEKLNTVLYNDSTYMAIQPSQGVLPTDTDYWQLIGGGLRREDIVDNLDSNDATKMLSAKQGKVLNDIAKKKAYYFDTVALMKAASLENGDYVITKGYTTANDGGGAEYLITDTSSNTDYQEVLNNGLYATLIIKEKTVNVKQVGGDVNNIIGFDVEKIIFDKDTYDISSTITINKKVILDFNGSTVNYTGNTYLFDIQTRFNNKPLITNGTFTGTVTNNFAKSIGTGWGNSFDVTNSVINKFAIVFDCSENFNNKFENLRINSNGIFKFIGTNISNAIVFDKCYIKCYSSDDVYPSYKMTLTNVKNMLFTNCCFEQFTTLIENTNCSNISFIACEFEQFDYIAKTNNGLANFVFNNYIIGDYKIFENDTIQYSPYILGTSNVYYDTENDGNKLRSKVRQASNLRRIHSDVYTQDRSGSVRLWDISDAKMDFYIPINVLRNEAKEANTTLETSISPITSWQQDESFLFTVYNYLISSSTDYQFWKSEFIQINPSNIKQLSQEKIYEVTWSGSGLYGNTITESMTNSKYTVTSSATTSEKYTIIVYRNLGTKIR